MVRFIFLCMAVVALSILTVAAQFMVNSIQGSRDAVTARNTVAAPVTETATADTLTFEQIYAMHAAPSGFDGDIDPALLNAIETAAGGDDFGNGFTGVAPSALADDAPATQAIMSDALDDASN